MGELAQSLNEVLLDSNEAEARSTEVRQWEEAEAAWAGDQEAARRREEGLGLKKQEAEAARVRAETRLEEALRELRKRDAERGVSLVTRISHVFQRVSACLRDLAVWTFDRFTFDI